MTAETPGAGVLGNTQRGLKVFAPTHDSYKNLERVRLLGAKPSELGHLARQAHPNYRAVDHEEASIMHHQRQNFHAARAHQAASEAMAKSEDSSRAFGLTESGKRISNKPAHKYGSGFSAEDHLEAYHHHQAEANGYFQSGNRDKAIEHDELADGHLHAFDGKRAAEGIKKSLGGPAGLGATASGKAILPAFSSPLQWVYAGMDPRTGIDDAAVAIQAVTPDWTPQDHGAAYHELALHFARATPPDDRSPVCAAAAFMHLAACGIDPAVEPLIVKSFLVPDPKAKPIDLGPQTAAKYPSMTADEHLSMAKRHLNAGSTKRALRHIQAAHHVGKQKILKADRKPLGAAFSHARKVAARTGGGKAKERRAANSYLKNKGIDPVKKSVMTFYEPLIKSREERQQALRYALEGHWHADASDAENKQIARARDSVIGRGPKVKPGDAEARSLAAKHAIASHHIGEMAQSQWQRGKSYAGDSQHKSIEAAKAASKAHPEVANAVGRSLHAGQMSANANNYGGSGFNHMMAGKAHIEAGTAHLAAGNHAEAKHHFAQADKHGDLAASDPHPAFAEYQKMGSQHLANTSLPKSRRSQVKKAEQIVTLVKATRYEGLSGGDLDNLQDAHRAAKERGKDANRGGSPGDHIIASGMHMYAARLHKQNAPQARDRILYHLKEARQHAAQAGGKPATRSYTENKEFLERRHQDFQDRRRKPQVRKSGQVVTLMKINLSKELSGRGQ